MSSKIQHEAASEAGILRFFKRQYFDSAPDFTPSLNLTGKIGIVTGSNIGLGLESARHLLSQHLSHLILAVRSTSKGEIAAIQLRGQFSKAKIEVWPLELESYKSISSFADHCRQLGRIDVAILNAGLAVKHLKLGKETNHETTIQVNYLSTVLLALLLVPILRPRDKESAPGRLTLVGSDTAYGATLNGLNSKALIKSLDSPRKFDGYQQYTRSKLLLIFFVAKLQEVLKPEDVIVNIAWPGLCKSTQIMRKPDGTWIMRFVVGMIGKDARKGAKGIVNAAIVQEGRSHGSIISEGIIKPYPSVVYGASGNAIKEQLWAETVQELEVAGLGLLDFDFKKDTDGVEAS